VTTLETMWDFMRDLCCFVLLLALMVYGMIALGDLADEVLVKMGDGDADSHAAL